MSFSFHRFILLLKMQLAVNRRFYVLGTLAIAGILLVYMFFRAANGTFGFEFDAQEENYELSILLLSIVFGTMIFRQLVSKTGRVQSLMLPVSALERLGVASLMVLVVFPLVYTLVYFFSNALANLADVHVFRHPNALYVFNGGNEWKMLALMYMMLPVVLLCAVWFRKLTFVKTIVLLCGALLVYSFFNGLVARWAVTTAEPANAGGRNFLYWSSMPLQSLTVVSKITDDNGMQQQIFNVSLPAGQQWIFTIFICFIPLFFLYLTYLKLREQEL